MSKMVNIGIFNTLSKFESKKSSYNARGQDRPSPSTPNLYRPSGIFFIWSYMEQLFEIEIEIWKYIFYPLKLQRNLVGADQRSL